MKNTIGCSSQNSSWDKNTKSKTENKTFGEKCGSASKNRCKNQKFDAIGEQEVCWTLYNSLARQYKKEPSEAGTKDVSGYVRELRKCADYLELLNAAHVEKLQAANDRYEREVESYEEAYLWLWEVIDAKNKTIAELLPENQDSRPTFCSRLWRRLTPKRRSKV